MTLEKEKNKSVLTTFKLIYEIEGISAFFNGVLPNLILVSNPIIYFVVYEQLKAYFVHRQEISS